MSNIKDKRIFLIEALPLIATYLYDKNVKLYTQTLGVSSLRRQEDELDVFLKEIESRHALACAIKLQEILPAIERGFSTSRVMVRSESKEKPRGRLDIPLYINRRANHKSFPRSYPVLLDKETPQTPENVIVVQALRGLALQLGRSPFARNKSEGLKTLVLYNWTRTRLRRWPWVDVRVFDHIKVLSRQVEQRIRKRQTGNEPAYKELLSWLIEWEIDVRNLSSILLSSVAEGILAFPQTDAFWNKIFEIWCLQKVAQSLHREGFMAVTDPVSLEYRHNSPIYKFEWNDTKLEVWFQSQHPLKSPEWRYRDNDRPLTGIPDIIISSNNHSPLIIDAKFREVQTDLNENAVTMETRSEETYKMLGYAENFRRSFEIRGFHGIIILVGEHSTEKVMVGPDNGRISLFVINPTSNSRNNNGLWDRAVTEWLTLATTDKSDGGCTITK